MNAYKYIILLILVSFVTTNAYAKLYRWTDKNGEFHVSDRPPLNPNKVKLKNSQRVKPIVKKRKKTDAKMLAWRCKELEKQYETALNKAIRFSTNKNLAASMKSDAENYELALKQICN